MEFKKRVVKGLLYGAFIGLATEFFISPIFEKPIEKKVEEIIK